MPAGPDLTRQLQRLLKVARQAGHSEATAFLLAEITDLQKTDRERAWPLGRCDWCYILHNRLREAETHDPHGVPVCWPCAEDS